MNLRTVKWAQCDTEMNVERGNWLASTVVSAVVKHWGMSRPNRRAWGCMFIVRSPTAGFYALHPMALSETQPVCPTWRGHNRL